MSATSTDAFRTLISALMLCAFSQHVMAEQMTELDTVVVTGTRSEKLLSDTPVRTELVTRQEIQAQHARDVKDALEVVPGLLLKPIHGKSGYEVWMQGLDSDRVKILIDGDPVATSTGSSVDVTQIDALDIERIEVVKGATSALYGSAAMGGVINIIPRKINPGLHQQARFEAGSYGRDNFSDAQAEATSLLASYIGSYQGEHHYLSLGTSQRKSDGFDATPGTWASQGPKGVRRNLDVKLGWTPTPTRRFEIFVNNYREDLVTRTATNAGGKIIQQVKEENTDRRRIGSKIAWEAQDSSFSWRLLDEDFQNVTFQDVLSTPEKENARRAEHDNFNTAFDLSWSPNDDHLLGAGIEWKEEKLMQTQNDVNEVPPGTGNHRAELYLQDDIFVSDQLEIVPGIRTQRDSDFGYYSAPKINARYDFTPYGQWETFIRSGIGTGYRVPNLKERHYVFDHSHLGYMVVGNPDLGPEKSNSYQLGLGLLRNARQETQSNIDINFFFNDVEDLIETAFNEELSAARSDGVNIFSYVNVDKAKTYGAELVYTQQFSSPWSLSLGYTQTQGKDKTSNKHLPNRPKHQFKTTLRFRSDDGRLTWTLNHNFLDRTFIDLENQRQSPASNIFDLKLNFKLTDWLEVYSGIDNFTDLQRDFSNPDDQRSVTGRFFYLGINLSNQT
ncbi:MAG: TonB-dependent receptor [Oleiphilus sp.]|nr:MAG: TonB-dependent receptor [Oleiphilus sp.]